MIYSFDVFDTLITRKVATPYGIFSLMQDILKNDSKYSNFSEHIVRNFYYLRCRAERTARFTYCNGEREEVTLKEIYDIIRLTGCIDEKQVDELIDLEKQTELNNVVGIKDNIELCLKMKEKENSVVLISDMYLDKRFIRELLLKVDKRLDNIKIYVSSEYSKCKGTGHLFETVKAIENVDYSKWIHFGDDPVADVMSPRKLGIEAQQLPQKKLLPIESNALECYGYDAALQYLIGTASNARIICNIKNESDRRIFDYGASLATLISTGYLLWVLRKAMDMGIKNLYFIARDGYLLKCVADRIISINNYKINTYYIYGSRKAWRPAVFNGNNINIPEYIRYSDDDDGDLEKIAKRFGLEYDEFRRFLSPKWYDRETVPRADERQELANYLQNNIGFRTCLKYKAKEKRKVIGNYFNKNIDFSKRDYAFVEFDGSGYTQYVLSDIISEYTDYPVKTFFFHIGSDCSNSNCEFYTYCPGILDGVMLETLFMAPHGTTEGYLEEDGNIKPIFEQVNPEINECFIKLYHEGFMAFLNELDHVPDVGIEVIDYYVRYITYKTDIDLRDFIGDIPFSYSGRDKEVCGYAPKLSIHDLEYMHKIRLMEPLLLFYHGANYPFSLSRCNEEEIRKTEEFRKERNLYSTHRERIKFWKNSSISWARAAGCESLLSKTGDRIALYGAGTVGKMIEGIIELDKRKKLEIWVDRNYELLKKEGWPIMPVSELYRSEYDSVIIGIADKAIAEEVRKQLIEKGIHEEIVYIYETDR